MCQQSQGTCDEQDGPHALNPRPIRQSIFVDNADEIVERLSLLCGISNVCNGLERRQGECVTLADLVLGQSESSAAIIERPRETPTAEGFPMAIPPPKLSSARSQKQAPILVAENLSATLSMSLVAELVNAINVLARSPRPADMAIP